MCNAAVSVSLSSLSLLANALLCVFLFINLPLESFILSQLGMYQEIVKLCLKQSQIVGPTIPAIEHLRQKARTESTIANSISTSIINNVSSAVHHSMDTVRHKDVHLPGTAARATHSLLDNVAHDAARNVARGPTFMENNELALMRQALETQPPM
jgi:hypothetical protein